MCLGEAGCGEDEGAKKQEEIDLLGGKDVCKGDSCSEGSV